jgi:hypothetical protein
MFSALRKLTSTAFTVFPQKMAWERSSVRILTMMVGRTDVLQGKTVACAALPARYLVREVNRLLGLEHSFWGGVKKQILGTLYLISSG